MLTKEEARAIATLMRMGVKTFDGDAFDNATAAYIQLRARIEALASTPPPAVADNDAEDTAKATEAA